MHLCLCIDQSFIESHTCLSKLKASIRARAVAVMSIIRASTAKQLRPVTSTNMPRVTLSALPQSVRYVPSRSFIAARRNFAQTPENGKGKQNSTPGWEGRHGDDHVLHRDKNDAQGKASNEAREDKEAGKEGSSAISQKDERNSNQKAKEEFPEAPGPIIGMNSGKPCW